MAENPNFGPLCRNANPSLKMNCISFSRLKILSHMQKNFEKFNIEILRKVLTRRTYGQKTHALDDPCVLYDIVP